MKTRTQFTLVVLLLASASILWIFRHRISEERAPDYSPSSGSKDGVAERSSGPPRTANGGGKGSSLLRSVFQVLNHNAIEFYGRAVDQNGDGVPGAYVKGSVLVNNLTSSGRRVAEATTDEEGYFEFHGLSEQDLGILIKKEGYEYHPLTSSFSYTHFEADHKRHKPDPNNPAVLKLWKLKGAEKLVHYERSWRALCALTWRLGG